MAKQTHLTLRLSQAEAAQIEADAGVAGLSVSAFVRAALRERGNLDKLAAALARDLAAELRSETAGQTAEIVSKLRVISDQIHDLTAIVVRSKP